MLSDSQRFAFSEINAAIGPASSLPYLPLNLTYQKRSLEVLGLLDTGATVNVLPYPIGTQLGAVWDKQVTRVQLTGNLAQYEARALIVMATVGAYNPVKLAFAWTRATNVPMILGQVNFFLEFDVCFSRAQRLFEIRPKKVN